MQFTKFKINDRVFCGDVCGTVTDIRQVPAESYQDCLVVLDNGYSYWMHDDALEKIPTEKNLVHNED